MIRRFVNWLNGFNKNKALKAKPVFDFASKQLRVNASPKIAIQPDDPIVDHFLSRPLPTGIDHLNLASPVIEQWKKAGVQVTVPLISQGQLVGTINLGRRLSEQGYSTEDKHLLDLLASHAAPTLRVAQMVRQQQAEVVERERLEYELRVARLIQQKFLPKQMPSLPHWKIAAHYQPARAVGGDFYDFQQMPDGRLSIAIGDVTDHGIPAALVMVGARAILRDSSRQLSSPAAILERANKMLFAEIPSSMFVTCLYAILDPSAGTLRYANAGQNLPIHKVDGNVAELYATGMPLGIMEDVQYEEKETIIGPDQCVLFYSDGLVETRNSGKELFGEQRLKEILSCHSTNPEALIATLLCEMNDYAGKEAEQEDDVTLVTLHHDLSG